jgi:hypothetical protein
VVQLLVHGEQQGRLPRREGTAGHFTGLADHHRAGRPPRSPQHDREQATHSARLVVVRSHHRSILPLTGRSFTPDPVCSNSPQDSDCPLNARIRRFGGYRSPNLAAPQRRPRTQSDNGHSCHGIRPPFVGISTRPPNLRRGVGTAAAVATFDIRTGGPGRGIRTESDRSAGRPPPGAHPGQRVKKFRAGRCAVQSGT